MFHFPWYRFIALFYSDYDDWVLPQTGFPIRKSTSNKACLPLLVAYRSLPRPHQPPNQERAVILSILRVSGPGEFGVSIRTGNR